MKKILLTVAMATLCGSVYAQWATSGNNIYYNPGNVGIGTTTPSYPFDVTGSGRFTTGVYVNDGQYFGVVSSIGATWANNTILYKGYSSTNGDYSELLVPGWHSYNANIRLLSNGYVGIGTTSPTYTLDVTGQGRFANGAFVNDGQAFGVVSPIGATWANNVILYKGYDSSVGGDFAEMLVPSGRANAANLRLLVDGSVAIGSPYAHGYKLAVNGSVIATSMTVQLSSAWPDYVFKQEYHLPALPVIKRYIDQNHHLPDMPSAAEVTREGINLGEMNKLLTKKVEELTLYLIEKDQENKELKQAMKAQQEDIALIKKQLETLTKTLDNK